MSCNENEFKTNARSNSIPNSKYSTGFDKVVSSGWNLYKVEFIVPRNLVSRKHYHFYSKRLILRINYCINI